MRNLWIICLSIFLTEISETSISNSLESATYLEDAETTIASTDITSTISTSMTTIPSTDASTITPLPTSMSTSLTTPTTTDSMDTTTSPTTDSTDITTPITTETSGITTPTTTDSTDITTPITTETSGITTPTTTDSTDITTPTNTDSTDITTTDSTDITTPTTTDSTDTTTPTNTDSTDITTPTTTDSTDITTTDSTDTTTPTTTDSTDITTPTNTDSTDVTTPTTTDSTDIITPTNTDSTDITITDSTDITTPTTTDSTDITSTTTESVTTTTSITESTTTTPRPYFLGSENITWNPRYAEDLIVTTDEGYKIAVTIKDCNFEENEFATFFTDYANETVMIARYVIQNTSVFWNRNILYAHFNGTSASNLTVIFSKMGEEITTTTTEITTTTEFLPTPTVNDSYELGVHLTGLDPYQYRDSNILLAFEEMISSMAREYCQNNNFELIDEITTKNVKITEIIRCNNSWPTCNPCVKVIFAVPINIKENSFWSGYQLNSANLQIMWDKYSQSYLGMGISTCEQPNINSWIKWNIIGISIVTGVILIFLLILRYYINKLAKGAGKSNMLMNDVAPVALNDERVAEDELPPHYLQEMPKLFDNAYPMYNPDG